jgi:hypothetical protein
MSKQVLIELDLPTDLEQFRLPEGVIEPTIIAATALSPGV